MKLSRTSLPAALRLNGKSATAATTPPRPNSGGGYEAESSTAAQKRQELESASSTSSTTRPKLPFPGFDLSSSGSTSGKRRRGPKAISLIRAQKFAQALQDATPPSKIDIPQFSATGAGAGMTIPSPSAQPTLADLEAKRPDRDPPHVTASSYGKQYQRIYDSIENAFNAKQLLKLAPELGVRVRKGRGKDSAIRGILKTWGWEDPKLAVAIHLAREARDRDWELSRAELWLIMRDAKCVRPALEEGIKLSVAPLQPGMEGRGSQGVKVLRGHGDSEALAELDHRIAERRTTIKNHTEIYQLQNTQLSSDTGLLGTISNASGAFLEPINNRSIRLSALNSAHLAKAIALLTSASAYTSIRANSPLSLVSPSPNLEISLFPHIPSSFSAVPWQEIGKLSKPLFRARGIQPWETKVGMRDVTHREERLGEGSTYGVAGGSAQLQGHVQGLADRLAKTLQAGEGITTTARFGHLLFPDASSDASLLAPSKRSRWSAEGTTASPISDGRPVFLPSPPPAVIHFPISGLSRKERRVRYQSRSMPGRYLDISHVVPATDADTNAASGVQKEVGSGWHKELDAQLASLELEGVEGEDSSEVAAPKENLEPKLEARVVEEKSEDLLMPDRPIDLIITSSKPSPFIDVAEISSNLSSYLLQAKGLAPSTIQMQGEEWTLYSAVEVDILEQDLSSSMSPIESEMNVQPSKILLRSIKSTDLILGQARVVRYAEVETDGELLPAFWEQLAIWSRAVAPGAGQLRNAVY